MGSSELYKTLEDVKALRSSLISIEQELADLSLQVDYLMQINEVILDDVYKLKEYYKKGGMINPDIFDKDILLKNCYTS